eukprot:TRINITY_DN55497_c0_g1_i1.p2 TRINITY_DN55497_c0_g1~~TRINITY_DN55497_c0_g1_i1.p2  ORF type:complete len:220 (-),score=5.37 TRINITY_DN55497_c0_g1_i1:241-870(-)
MTTSLYTNVVENVVRALRGRRVFVQPELANRIIGLAWGSKHDLQLKLEKMEVVGTAANGQVEAICAPTGFLRELRLHPRIANSDPMYRRRLMVSAVCDARRQGRELMQQAEEQVYAHFLVAVDALLEPLDQRAESLVRDLSLIDARSDSVQKDKLESAQKFFAELITLSRDEMAKLKPFAPEPPSSFEGPKSTSAFRHTTTWSSRPPQR